MGQSERSKNKIVIVKKTMCFKNPSVFARADGSLVSRQHCLLKIVPQVGTTSPLAGIQRSQPPPYMFQQVIVGIDPKGACTVLD